MYHIVTATDSIFITPHAAPGALRLVPVQGQGFLGEIETGKQESKNRAIFGFPACAGNHRPQALLFGRWVGDLRARISTAIT
jgi:hypothetical protein